MKIKIPKPYWIVGTLVAAGIVTVGAYNLIVAETQEKSTIETSNLQNNTNQTNQTENNYQEQIDILMQRLDENEKKITELQEKVATLENENSNKAQEISNLKKYTPKNTITKTVTVNNTDLEQVKQKLATTTEKVEKVDSSVTNRKEELNQKKKRIEEIKVRLKEINIGGYIYIERNTIEAKLEELSKKEQNEEVINEINKLKMQLEDINKIIEEKETLDNEIKKLQKEMLEM